MVSLNQAVPDFSFCATGDLESTLSACQGKNVVLYFYPKDNTPGCTSEGQDFSSLHPEFAALDTCIFGVSRDSLASHEKFKSKYQYAFDLISDADESLCKLFDVLKPKNLYGKQFIGIERSTFLVDSRGFLRQEWRKVKVKGHAEAVLDAVRALRAG